MVHIPPFLPQRRVVGPYRDIIPSALHLVGEVRSHCHQSSKSRQQSKHRFYIPSESQSFYLQFSVWKRVPESHE